MNELYLRLKSKRYFILKIILLYQIIFISIYLNISIGEIHNPQNLYSDVDKFNDRLNLNDPNYDIVLWGTLNNYFQEFFSLKPIIEDSCQKILDPEMTLKDYISYISFFVSDQINQMEMYFLVLDEASFNWINGELNITNRDNFLVIDKNLNTSNGEIKIGLDSDTNVSILENKLNIFYHNQFNSNDNPIFAEINDKFDLNIIIMSESMIKDYLYLFQFSSTIEFFFHFNVDKIIYNKLIFSYNIHDLMNDVVNDILNNIPKLNSNIRNFNYMGNLIRASKRLNPVKDLITINYNIISIFILFIFFFLFNKFSMESLWNRYNIEIVYIQTQINRWYRFITYFLESIFISLVNILLISILGTIVNSVISYVLEIKSNFNVNSILLEVFIIIFILYFSILVYNDFQIVNKSENKNFHDIILSYKGRSLNLNTRNFLLSIGLSLLFNLLLNRVLEVSFVFILVIMYIAIFILSISEITLKITTLLNSRFRIAKKKLSRNSILNSIWHESQFSRIKYYLIIFTIFLSIIFIQFSLSVRNSNSAIYLNNNESFYIQFDGNLNESLIEKLKDDNNIQSIQTNIYAFSDLNTNNNSNRNLANFFGLNLTEISEFYQSSYVRSFIKNFSEIENNFYGAIVSTKLSTFYTIGDQIQIFYFNRTLNAIDSTNIVIQGFYDRTDFFYYDNAVILPVGLIKDLFTISNTEYTTKINIRPKITIDETYSSIIKYTNKEFIFANLENKIILDSIITKSELILIFYFALMLFALILNNNILNPKETNLKRVLSYFALIKNQKQIILKLYYINSIKINIFVFFSYIILILTFISYSMQPIVGYIDLIQLISLLIELFFKFSMISFSYLFIFLILLNLIILAENILTIRKFDYKRYLRFYE